MVGRRTARLNEQFKREISRILHREVRDPRIGRPTVTAVRATPDLWSARVYVRPGPAEDAGGDEPEMLAGLEAATPFIRRALGERLTLRRIPELRFEVDHTLDEAMRIERILREVLPPGDDAPHEAPDEGSERASRPEGDEGGA